MDEKNKASTSKSGTGAKRGRPAGSTKKPSQGTSTVSPVWTFFARTPVTPSGASVPRTSSIALCAKAALDQAPAASAPARSSKG